MPQSVVDVLKIHDFLKDRSLGKGQLVIVDRVWPRGIAKDDVRHDYWLKGVAPSTELRKWFNHDPAKFEKFARLYREELDVGNDDVTKLLQVLKKNPVTLLYAAKDRKVNHAVVLADWLTDRCSRT